MLGLSVLVLNIYQPPKLNSAFEFTECLTLASALCPVTL